MIDPAQAEWTREVRRRLRHARETAGMTRARLARLANVTESKVIKAEMGRCELKIDLWLRLNAVLGPLPLPPAPSAEGA